MRRAALAMACAAAASGCLVPGDPLLAVRDEDPPEFLAVEPLGDAPISLTQRFLVTFSERMDPESLRPGILLRQGERRHPLQIVRPRHESPDAAEQADLPYTVLVRPETELQPGTLYRLVLTDVLTDTAGNPLEITGVDPDEMSFPFETTP